MANSKATENPLGAKSWCWAYWRHRVAPGREDGAPLRLYGWEPNDEGRLFCLAHLRWYATWSAILVFLLIMITESSSVSRPRSNAAGAFKAGSAQPQSAFDRPRNVCSHGLMARRSSVCSSADAAWHLAAKASRLGLERKANHWIWTAFETFSSSALLSDSWSTFLPKSRIVTSL